ncbi:MAG: peroxiredoxin family protein [Woeseiaceae bacterium]
MKSLVAVLTLMALVAAPQLQAAETAPDWALRNADGEPVRLSREVEEQPVILFFWATWCPYCKALMPHLQSIRLEYGDKLKILAIGIRDPKGDPVGYVEKQGYDFIVLPGGDAVAELYGIFATPGVIVVDSERIMRWDLRALPPLELSDDVLEARHSRRAAHRAPYWAAELRKALDELLATD